MARRRLEEVNTLTIQIVDAVVRLVENGSTVKDACRYLAISDRLLARWLELANEDPTSEYAYFKLAIERAESKLIQNCEKLVVKGAQRDWKAAAWLLSKRRPETYGSAPTNTLPTSSQGVFTQTEVNLVTRQLTSEEGVGDGPDSGE